MKIIIGIVIGLALMCIGLLNIPVISPFVIGGCAGITSGWLVDLIYEDL